VCNVEFFAKKNRICEEYTRKFSHSSFSTSCTYRESLVSRAFVDDKYHENDLHRMSLKKSQIQLVHLIINLNVLSTSRWIKLITVKWFICFSRVSLSSRDCRHCENFFLLRAILFNYQCIKYYRPNTRMTRNTLYIHIYIYIFIYI